VNYTVTREGRTLLTLHEGTDTTACHAAVVDLESRVDAMGSVTDWTITDVAVFEGPVGPFDPYTIEATFSVRVTVSADGRAEAKTAGETAIAAALTEGNLESITYESEPTVSSG